MISAIETTATIGVNRQLTLDQDLPDNISSKVRVIVLFDGEDFEEKEWLGAAAGNAIFDFLNDPAEDIYNLADGTPFTDEP